MIDIQEVDNTIEKLVNGPTTFDSCQKLASLYIVKQYFENMNNNSAGTYTNEVEELEIKPEVLKEYEDILPEYNNYCILKRKYKNHQIDNIPVIESLYKVCMEIQEFIHILYSSSDMSDERALLEKYMGNLVN